MRIRKRKRKKNIPNESQRLLEPQRLTVIAHWLGILMPMITGLYGIAILRKPLPKNVHLTTATKR